MKETRIKTIIGLMTFAVIGLISVQIYWLTSLIKVEKEKFDRIVINSLVKVANKLEKDEAVKTVFNKITVRDKANPQMRKKITVTSGNFNFIVKDSIASNHIIHMINDDEMQWEHDIDSLDKRRLTQVKMIDIPGNRTMSNKMPRMGYFINHKVDTLIRSKKKLVQNVVTEMMQLKILQPIEKRVTKAKLNKLLSDEFTNKGIDGDFYYGVNKVNKDSLTLIKQGTDIQKLRKSDYKTLLFSEEMFASKNELIVYFPNQKKFILGSVVGMLALSVGFILLIVGVFYKSVQMFIRQKKITAVKNDLINNITHEFKTPISTISLACEALNEPLLSSEKKSVARYSKIIKEENDRLQLMVDTLLNTAAMERDELKIRKDEVNLDQIISSALTKFDEVLRLKDGSVSVINKNPACIIIGDKFHLTNVFCNLIDNAIKYNEKKPDLKIKVIPETDFISVEITDNGIGIPKESLHKIFETFYRVQVGNIQNFRGNGIGLSYSKKIVELHGGKIVVNSEPGKGSTFSLIIPSR
jgi:two-component system, OmpR family, phosphate regulon sensor histidine kinase PhoR